MKTIAWIFFIFAEYIYNRIEPSDCQSTATLHLHFSAIFNTEVITDTDGSFGETVIKCVDCLDISFWPENHFPLIIFAVTVRNI